MSKVLPIHLALAPVQARAGVVVLDERLAQYEDWDVGLQLTRRYPFVMVDRVTPYRAGGVGGSPHGSRSV